MADPKDQPTPATEDVKNPPAAATPAVDVQDQINQALSDHDKKREAELRTELKELTGFASLKEFKEAQLTEQGKTQELLDSKSTELAAVTKRFQDSQINAALLGAAGEAVDAGTVVSLLTGDCECNDDGTVTVNGKTPADAVNALLKEKPFLAKAQGDAGSGAPQTTQGKNSMSRSDFDALDGSAKSEFVRAGGTVV